MKSERRIHYLKLDEYISKCGVDVTVDMGTRWIHIPKKVTCKRCLKILSRRSKSSGRVR